MREFQDVPVKLHIYDLSHGLARTHSEALLGRQVCGAYGCKRAAITTTPQTDAITTTSQPDAITTTSFSPQIEGVWHTGVVVGDTEYYYGHGIHAARAGRTIAGSPDRVIDLGNTSLATEVAESYLVALSEGRFSPTSYNIVHNNCNNFADEFSRFLTGQGVPVCF